MATAVTQMTAEEREEYKQRLLAKSHPTDRDLRHLARIAKLEGTGGPAAPRAPKAPRTPKEPTPAGNRRTHAQRRRVRTALPIDNLAVYAVSKSQNMLIPWILMASYTYYVHNVSMLSDERYDLMCKSALGQWDSLTHRHKFLLSTEMLEAGSLYQMTPDDYPVTVRGAAAHLLADTTDPIDMMKGVDPNKKQWDQPDTENSAVS